MHKTPFIFSGNCCEMMSVRLQPKLFFFFLEMAKPSYLYTGKTFILPQKQGKDTTLLFLCVKSVAACCRNCSPAFDQRN